MGSKVEDEGQTALDKQEVISIWRLVGICSAY